MDCRVASASERVVWYGSATSQLHPRHTRGEALSLSSLRWTPPWAVVRCRYSSASSCRVKWMIPGILLEPWILDTGARGIMAVAAGQCAMEALVAHSPWCWLARWESRTWEVEDELRAVRFKWAGAIKTSSTNLGHWILPVDLTTCGSDSILVRSARGRPNLIWWPRQPRTPSRCILLKSPWTI